MNFPPLRAKNVLSSELMVLVELHRAMASWF
jgi:hypothetical protein